MTDTDGRLLAVEVHAADIQDRDCEPACKIDPFIGVIGVQK